MLTRADQKAHAWQFIRAAADDLEALAREIQANPELGYQEHQASQWLCNFLSERGFQVDRPFGNLPTAFRARKTGGSGPVIAYLAEYDALPDIGHGCGHNLIGPMALGAALGASSVLEAAGGEVWVIGTPAEEYFGQVEGKIRLLESGAFTGVDVALMAHPHSKNQVMESDLGFIACDLAFHGQSAHAAADPWNGKNALDGLLATFANLSLLRQQLPPSVRIHGVITKGGQAPNIIPDHTSASFMVRAPDPGLLEEVYRRFLACAQAGALASDTQLEISRITTVYNTRINPILNRLAAENFVAIGRPLDEEGYRMQASSDFGNVSQALPACMLMLGSHPADIPWHSRQVAAASIEKQALNAMLDGACVLAGVGIDLLMDRLTLADVKKAFQQK